MRGAYDILTLGPDDLPATPDVTDEMVTVAETLQRATLEVKASHDSADFKLAVSMDGASCGLLQAAVSMSSGLHQEAFRLSTLETLLHTTRASAVAVGADLEVIASKN